MESEDKLYSAREFLQELVKHSKTPNQYHSWLYSNYIHPPHLKSWSELSDKLDDVSNSICTHYEHTALHSQSEIEMLLKRVSLILIRSLETESAFQSVRVNSQLINGITESNLGGDKEINGAVLKPPPLIDPEDPLFILYDEDYVTLVIDSMRQLKIFLDQFLMAGVSANIENPIDKNSKLKDRLKLEQIALIYFYNDKAITRENGNKIANRYDWASGSKLYQFRSKYSTNANRRGVEESLLKTTNKIATFEFLLSDLATKLSIHDPDISMPLEGDAKSRLVYDIKILKEGMAAEFPGKSRKGKETT